MSAPRLTLATGNPGKVAELRRLLGDRYEIEPRPDELPDTVEDGETLVVNAVKKATEVAVHSGSLAVADDTGLFVDALGGRPGVHTARYAGPAATTEENVELLLAELGGVDGDARSAHFATVIAAVWPDGRELTVEGRVDGRIAAERRGDAGFGYDPVFLPVEGDGRSFAQMSAEEKNAISHRGRAIAALLAALA
ncbi:MAG: RdgB/HAM1 family non-canonical purine NTP pyrophosphatase [Actinomycetota bacterium]